MEDLHPPNLRAMVGHLHHHNQTMGPLQTQLHRSVQVLCMVVQPQHSKLVVMVMVLQVQVNNLAMDHLLQHSRQSTLHQLPQDHSKALMVQEQDSLAMALLDLRQVMDQWSSQLHKLDKVIMLLPAMEVEAVVTNPRSSSNQDMEEQMQEVVEILHLLLVEVVAAVVEEPPAQYLSLVHMCLQQHKDSPSNHRRNQIKAVTATKLALDQDLLDMDLQMLHHHPLLEVHLSLVRRTLTHRQQSLLVWLHQRQHRHIHKDLAVLHRNRVTLLLHRQVGVTLHHNHKRNSSLSSNSHHHRVLHQLKQDFSQHRSSLALRDPHHLVLNLSNQVVMVSHHLSLFLLQLRLMYHHLQEVHKVNLRPILHILLDHSILILDILTKPMDLRHTLHHHKLHINIHDPQLRKCHLLGHRVLHPKASMELMIRVGFLGINRHRNNRFFHLV